MKRAQKPETRLYEAIKAALQWEPGLKLMRNANGQFRARGFHVKAGLGNGSADFVGILSLKIWHPDTATMRLVGRFIVLEVKREGEELDAAQVLWLSEVRALGGFGAMVTGPDSAREAIARARLGAYE